MRSVLHRFAKWILGPCGVVLIGFTGIHIYEALRYVHLKPPEYVRTIQDFRRWNPSFTEASVITSGATTYYAVRGPFARAFPSAHSIYYFDHAGNYLWRNVDPGDFPGPAIFSSPEAHWRAIAIEEIAAKEQRD